MFTSGTALPPIIYAWGSVAGYPPLAVLVNVSFVNFSHFSGSVCHYDTVLHFPNDWLYWASFHVLVFHLNLFFGKVSIQIPDSNNLLLPYRNIIPFLCIDLAKLACYSNRFVSIFHIDDPEKIVLLIPFSYKCILALSSYLTN